MGPTGDKRCPVTLLDLPNDILREILDYFQFVDETRKRISWKAHNKVLTKENKSRKQAVQRVRLVCRSLCQLASPLLCPVLRVSLNHRSLDAVKHLSENPFVAAGVRGIVVSLDYRPQELAADFTRYIKHQRDNLGSIVNHCYSFARIEFPRNREAETGNELQAAWPLWLKNYLKSIYRIHSACLAWNTDRSVSENILQARDEERREDQQIILRGFGDYRKRQEEQSRLVTDGSFVNSLASSIIHMPNTAGVAFSHMENSPNIHHCDPVSFQNKADLSEAMTAPLNWQEIEKLEASVDIIPSRILSELPISFHRSGVRLRSICIGCFPTKKGFSLIAPGQLWNANWVDFRKSCQYLKEFQIGGTGMNHRRIRYDYLTTKEKAPIDNYLNAVFSSAYLEDLDISFYALGLNDGRTTKEGFYRLSPIPPTANWQRMRRVKIANIESNQHDLETLCRGLGHSLEELIWHSIKLQKGRWLSVFDLLRERLQQRYSHQKFRIWVRYLSGGEFGVKEAKQQSLWGFRESDWEDDEELYTQIENYICSDGVRENPMMEWRLGQSEQ